MDREARPSEAASGVGPDGPGHPDPDTEGEVSPPAWVIPGNVGSLDDVPPHWVEEGSLAGNNEDTSGHSNPEGDEEAPAGG